VNIDEHFVREMTLAGTPEKFAEFLQNEVRKRAGPSDVRIYLRDIEHNTLLEWGSGEGRSIPVDDGSPEGKCVLDSDTIIGPGKNPAHSEEGSGSGNSGSVTVPVYDHGHIQAVITVSGHHGEMTDEKISLLKDLALLLPAGLRNVSAIEKLDNFSSHIGDFVEQSVDCLSAQGPGHVKRVVNLSSELASLLELSRTEHERLWTSALYHDTGRVLLWDKASWEVERFHPRAGSEFLENIQTLRNAAPLVLCHHERYDGSGFPGGIGGDEAPLAHWVLALAEDAEEYVQGRKGFSLGDICSGFYRERAESHHPMAVEALSHIIDAGRFMRIFNLEGT